MLFLPQRDTKEKHKGTQRKNTKGHIDEKRLKNKQ
jgi:hypothetical protein